MQVVGPERGRDLEPGATQAIHEHGAALVDAAEIAERLEIEQTDVLEVLEAKLEEALSPTS